MIINRKEYILDFPITLMLLDACVAYIINNFLNNNSPSNGVFFCANPHSIVLTENDQLFRQALNQAEVLTPDGIGIILASKILGGCIRNRLTGSDIFFGLSKALDEKGGFKYFFLGSTDETLEKIRIKLSEDFPDICFAGSYSPPYKSEFTHEDSRLMIDAINHARPDVLWVGMTAPKQEKWIYQNREKLDVKFIGAIGAVFDFYTGNVKRSHPFFQQFGMEWLPRLLQEPRRLWRRNFISSPKFILKVIEQRLKYGKINSIKNN
jgi:N-acetylglucosaminyldiphosphoundecaprenol N-acetyl-beta-D-mannosaminyltransferase